MRGFLGSLDADVVENTPRTLPKGSRDLRSLRVLHNFRLRTPKGTPKWLSDIRSHPVAMLLLLRKKAREKAGHAQNLLPDRNTFGHVTDVTSGQKTPLGRIWCNFRLRMRIAYFRTVHVTGVTSGHVTDVTCGHVTSGHVTSGHVTSRNAQWSDPPQILTELYPYTTTLSPLLLPARVTNRSHSTYGSSARSDSHRAVFLS